MEHPAITCHEPWNKGKLVGQKSPLKLKDIWAVRIRLQIANRTRDLALFDLAIDSKLRACDLVRLRVRDVVHGDRVAARAIVMQQKTQRPVQFEITEQTREAVARWIERARLKPEDLPVSQPAAPVAASIHPAIRADRRQVGAGDRLGPGRLWHPFAAAHKGVSNLPTDEKPQGCAAASRSHEAGEHGAVPRD
jgi:integrase